MGRMTEPIDTVEQLPSVLRDQWAAEVHKLVAPAFVTYDLSARSTQWSGQLYIAPPPEDGRYTVGRYFMLLGNRLEDELLGTIQLDVSWTYWLNKKTKKYQRSLFRWVVVGYPDVFESDDGVGAALVHYFIQERRRVERLTQVINRRLV